MQTTFRVSSSEFTIEFMEKIKAFLDNQSEVEITIKKKSDDIYPGISFDEACKKVSLASKAYDEGTALYSSSDVLKHLIK